MSTEKQERSTALADQLHSAAIHLLRKLRREDAASGLNAPRLSALSVVVFAGPLTLGDLAAAEQVRPPTMTRLVDALVEQGLVVKEKNVQDGRSTLIHATTAGKTLLMQGRERRVRALAAQIAGLGEKDRAALEKAAEILRKVIADIKSQLDSADR
jgi:DNA-binding MarR family transcriptional regulator